MVAASHRLPVQEPARRRRSRAGARRGSGPYPYSRARPSTCGQEIQQSILVALAELLQRAPRSPNNPLTSEKHGQLRRHHD